ncbi:MAG: adenylate/guanylate cyclase domain-containing protein [Anaerolineaceae bacterium]
MIAELTAELPPAIEGAVLFTDIVGFTEFTALRGDSEALALLGRQEEIVTAALPPGARIVKELGDGLLLWFPDPCSALETAVSLQERFESESPGDRPPLWVRMGLHWGRQTRRGDDIVGHDVNVASRIVNQSGPGEVLLSAETVARIGADAPGFCFDELGPVFMKGLPAPIRLFRASRAATN